MALGLCGRASIFLTGLLVLTLAAVWHRLTEAPPMPELSSQWWGPGDARQDDPTIRPFSINVSDAVIKDLKHRLKSVPALTPPLEGIGFEYGFNSKYLQEVLEFWRTKYDWREREKFLNQFPQFKTEVSGLQLHFLHVKPRAVPAGTTVLPLLLMHGWPGSVREFYDVIPLLTTPRPGEDFVFEVVVPSLPGYGFSQGAAKPGMGPAQMAVVMRDLMERIGLKRFYIQGGDAGGVVGMILATVFPERVLGFHSNFCFLNSASFHLKRLLGSLWPSLLVDTQHVDKIYPLAEKLAFQIEESGYMHIQATKPDTVGIGLRDSPAGLAAYILEKFSTWTNKEWKSLPDGGITKKFSLTALLDNVMIYWITGSITTSFRLYSETFNKQQMALQLDSIPTTAPSACQQFPEELMFLTEQLARDKLVNLRRFSVAPRGGHFAALEEPRLLADDLWKAVRTFRS